MENNLNKNLNQQNQIPGVDPKLIDGLLTAASKKLGCKPDELKRKLQNGEFEAAVKNSNPTTPQMIRFKQMLGDPKAIERLMSDPKAAEILKKLGGK